jgi:hypothetical protein
MGDSLRETVARALSAMVDPPEDLETVIDEGTWNSVVTARERDVLWRFVCEKSVWRLEAGPSWAPGESFDADLLARHFLGHGFEGPKADLEELMQISVSDLVNELQQIRRPVVEAFREGGDWPELRAALMMSGRRRDFELFGRPLPPGAA